MFSSTDLPATRTALLQLRREMSEAQNGRTLLERKREVLLRELWNLLREVRHTEQEVRQRFQEAYRALREARLAMGSEGIRWASLAPAARTSYTASKRSVMGVALPVVELAVTPLPLPYSPWGSRAAFDEARRRWLAASEVLGPWAEAITSVWRVAAEIERTQRRVNALENLLIPRYQQAIRRIEDSLEEQEREDFVRTKRVKERQEAGHD